MQKADFWVNATRLRASGMFMNLVILYSDEGA